MKEYKFRAWDKLNKVMSQVASIDILNNVVMVKPISDKGNQNLYILNFDDVELNQYTGLKDKNGKEIYEGDIVKQEYKLVRTAELYCGHQFVEEINEEYDEYLIGGVIISPTKGTIIRNGCTLIINGMSTYRCDEVVSESNCEVIGNIHDNLEFLKGGAKE